LALELDGIALRLGTQCLGFGFGLRAPLGDRRLRVGTQRGELGAHPLAQLLGLHVRIGQDLCGRGGCLGLGRMGLLARLTSATLNLGGIALRLGAHRFGGGVGLRAAHEQRNDTSKEAQAAGPRSKARHIDA
jgi:hypothetical protein